MEINMILILSYIILFSFSNANFLEMKFYFNVNLSKIESSNFYNEIIFNQLSTNISIGTPQQIIPLSIKVKLSTLSITSSILPLKKLLNIIIIFLLLIILIIFQTLNHLNMMNLEKALNQKKYLKLIIIKI